MKRNPQIENFWTAVECGDHSSVINFIENGVDINSQDKGGATPLMRAVTGKYYDLMKILIEHNADLNLQEHHGFSALHFAAQNYDKDATEILLQNNCQVDTQDQHGNTPLSTAVYFSQGRGSVIGLLLSSGANKDIKNKSDISAFDLAKTISNFDVLIHFGRKL